MTSASCQCSPWEATVMAHVVGLLPLTWETWFELQPPSHFGHLENEPVGGIIGFLVSLCLTFFEKFACERKIVSDKRSNYKSLDKWYSLPINLWFAFLSTVSSCATGMCFCCHLVSFSRYKSNISWDFKTKFGIFHEIWMAHYQSRCLLKIILKDETKE